MRHFKDAAGRDWSLDINVNVRKRVQADVNGLDLFTAIDGTLQHKLEDPETLVAVLFSVCAEQVEKQGLSPEQFAVGMVGDALDIASDALMGAIADFFPSRQRLVMNKALAKAKEAVDLAVKKATRKIDEMDLSDLLEKTLSESSTSSPAPAASIPAP